MHLTFSVGGGILNSDDFLFQVSELSREFPIVKNNHGVEYYNIPAAFDIEVTSFYDGPEISENKRAIMYIWQLGVYNLVVTGRTWKGLIALLNVLRSILNLSDTRKLVVYVHNLPYEFQFIRKRQEWQEVFILSKRKPVYAVANGIEFRCSLKLSGGKSLENVGKDLQKYKVEKAVGNLDYQLIRTPLTPLTPQEILYCENDIRVLLCYIQEKIEQDGDITRIPLTNTGYVREHCRKSCFKRWRSYHRLIQDLTIEPDEYSQLKRGFQGGFTHANAHYVDKVLENVGSHDLTSSYPSVMALEKFPMSKAKLITNNISLSDFLELLNTHCCIFELEAFSVSPKIYHEHPISRYKCYVFENGIVDNGRVVMAEHLKITCTEQDFFVYNEFYEWEDFHISNLRIYRKAYLPRSFVIALLGLYEKKTTLKDVEGEEINYMISKNMINACFGMAVTDPVREEIIYSGDTFIRHPKNIKEGVEKYNKNIRRFLYYPWGVWITAYARANLFSGIIAIGSDYVYSDTDSIKCLNPESHSEYFERYNQQIITKINASAEHFKINKNLYAPYTAKGEQKIIGTWDDEGVYSRFKTLGAKRYLTEKSPFQSTRPNRMITLAGANKKKTMRYLEQIGDPFEHFNINLQIPPEHAGRLILTYIDDETEGDIVDMNGVPYHYHELSAIHMEPSEYNLSRSEEFIKFLEGVENYGE